MKKIFKTAAWLTLLLCPNVNLCAGTLRESERMHIIQEEWDQHIHSLAINNVNQKLNNTKVFKRKENIKNQHQELVTIVSKEIGLFDLVKVLVRGVNVNAVFGPGVENKKVTVDIKNMPLDLALDTILFPIGYGFKYQGKSLIILAEETRIFRVNLPPFSQNFSDVTSNESFVQSQDNQSTESGKSAANQQVKLGTKVVVENISNGVSFWDDVQMNVKSLISKTGQFSINKPSCSVIVTDSPGVLNRLESFFNDLNKRTSLQIEVDVKVVEITFNDENRMGIDWNVLTTNLKELNRLNLATDFATGNFTGGNFFTFSGNAPHDDSGHSQGGVGFVMDALAKQGQVEIVSQPRVVMLNNQVSVIQVGSTQSYVDHTSVETTQTGTITSLSTSQVQEGVTMRLLGNIIGDQVFLSVTPVVTTIDNIRSIKSGTTTIEAPQTTTKSINTLVKLKEGQTVAIGGLITSLKDKNNQGVPVLSKIPLLGKIFEYNSSRQRRSELVVFITPKKA